MRIAVFSIKRYDREYLTAASQAHSHELVVLESRLLTEETAPLSGAAPGLSGNTSTTPGPMALSITGSHPFDGRMTASTAETSPARIDLYWIPLGAGGSGFVRLNGRIYEAIKARLERRRPCAIYHTALQLHVPEGRFVVETMWPSPDADTGSRGVVLEGAVGSRRLARLRTFRYEVRRWRNGVLPDADDAVGGPQRVSDDAEQARRLLEVAASVPALIWGRDQLAAGEMWNSNSVISWLLVRSGLSMEAIHPPEGGRAPGWDAGITIARGKPLSLDAALGTEHQEGALA